MAYCLVTGGAGFIGAHLVEGLLRHNHRVKVLDNFATSSPENLQMVQSYLASEKGGGTLEMIEGSILDSQVLAEAMQGIDYVFHEAALPSVAFSLQEPLLSHRVNTEGTLRVLLAARDAGVKRVMYAGSSSAYGNQPELPKYETQPPDPLSPYALAKLTGEQYCRLFTSLYNLETVVLRYFNVFGERQNPHSQYAAVIPKFIIACLKDEPLTVFGDGKQSRDFTYVSNVVRGNILAMTAPDAAGQIINLANGNRTSLLRLIAHLETLTGRRAHVKFLPTRDGDVRHSQAAIERAKILLGFTPQVDLQQGLQRTLAYYRQQLRLD